jgi:hypothetical protein
LAKEKRTQLGSPKASPITEDTLASFKIYMLKTEFMHNWIRSDYVLEIVIKKISNTSTIVPRLNMLFIPNTTFINGLYASAVII